MLSRAARRCAAGRRALSFSAPSPRQLKDIAKLPLLKRNRPERVREIWEKYHLDNQFVGASFLTAKEYYAIVRNARGCSFFVLPAAKGEGYFTLLAQWQDNACFLTFIDDYRQNPGGAQPYLVFNMYAELLTGAAAPEAESQPVVCRTDVCNPVLSKEEAMRITDLLVKHYTWPQLFQKVQDFNLRPRTFDFDKHIKQCLGGELLQDAKK